MNKLIDLHIHTNKSDGEYSPKEIIDEASNNNVSIISIADHDTIDAYNDELFNYAKSKKITIIPAVEISTKTERAGIHVLGYNFDLENEEFREALFNLRNSRHKYMKDFSQKLNELGYRVNVEKLDKIDAVTKAHIAQDIVENEENHSILMKVFGHIPKRGDFIEAIMNEGCPAYVKKQTYTPKEAVKVIRKAGGKAVLAHPICYKYEDGFTNEDIENLVNDMEPDGIEAYYVYVDKNDNKVNEAKYWSEFAKLHGLFATIGSDFHNKNGVHKEIGLIGEEILFPENEFNNLMKNIL